MKEDKPSATAHVIALSTVFLSGDRRFGHLVPDGATDVCRRCIDAYSPGGSRLLRLLDRTWMQLPIRQLENFTLPGIQLHYTLRKRYLEDVTRRSLQEGIRQVVVLGGGFDTLAFRLHRSYPDATFIEVDHPATQGTKRSALKNRTADNLRFLAVDFSRERLEEKLHRFDHFDPARRSLFLMEGVLMYLSAEDVNRTFSFVRGNRFAFTFMEPRLDGRVNFHNCSPTVNFWLRLKGEPFDWGIRVGSLRAFLENRGFRLLEVATPDTFRGLYLNGARVPLAKGEFIGVAE